MLAGMDIGNGYVKAAISTDGGATRPVDLPSVVDYIGRNAPWIPQEPTAPYMADLVNALDCDIESPAVAAGDAHRMLVGRRALQSGDTQIVFDIADRVPKCDSSLSYQLALSAIAAEAVRCAWERAGEVPEALSVSARMGVALPIADYMRYRATYRDRFTSGAHRVTVHNFERPVTVDVTFDAVRVLAEGEAAYLAVCGLSGEFMDREIADSRAAGAVIDDDVRGADLAGYANVVGVDVGEGTTNIPVIRDGRINVEASDSINQGFGNVLANVVEAARPTGFAPETRKDLADFLLETSAAPSRRRVQAMLQGMVDDEAAVFARTVHGAFSRVFSKVRLATDVVYVYGGGAAGMRDALLPELTRTCTLAEGVSVPVVYLGPDVARDLNRNGLLSAAAM